MSTKQGEILEISSDRGIAYAQVLRPRQKQGDLLRVYNGYWPLPLTSLDVLNDGETKFHLFMPVDRELENDRIRRVGILPVPPSELGFPTFRSGLLNPLTKRVEIWWLWNGEKEWKVGDLTAEQHKLSPDGMWDLNFLLGKLNQDWKPEEDFS